MIPSNRVKLQVERLEDRCTPGGLHLSIAQIAQLVQQHVRNPIAKLQRIENRAIRFGAPQYILNYINQLQAQLNAP